jgi:hypothetical protein
MRSLLYGGKVVVATFYANMFVDVSEYKGKGKGKPQPSFVEATLLHPTIRTSYGYKRHWRITGKLKGRLPADCARSFKEKEDLMWYNHGLSYHAPAVSKFIEVEDFRPSFLQEWEELTQNAELPDGGKCVIAVPDLPTENTLHRYLGDEYPIHCIQLDALCVPPIHSLPPKQYKTGLTCGVEHSSNQTLFTWRNPLSERDSAYLSLCHVCSQAAADTHWIWMEKHFRHVLYEPNPPYANGRYDLQRHRVYYIQMAAYLRRLLWRAFWGYLTDEDQEGDFWFLGETYTKRPLQA